MRSEASWALAALGEPAVAALISTLKDADGKVRISAAFALGLIRDARAIEPLIQVLGDADYSVGSQAAASLGKFGKPAIKPLVSALTDVDVTDQASQIKTLDGIKDEVTRFAHQLAVRSNVKDALVKNGEPAIEPLVAILQDANANWQVRRDSAEVLGEIKVAVTSARGIAPGDPRAETRLLVGLREHDSAVIVGAIRFFIRRGDESSKDALIEALNAHGDAHMAAAMLNSGSYDLEAAANRWASEHGYTRAPTQPGVPDHWGGR